MIANVHVEGNENHPGEMQMLREITKHLSVWCEQLRASLCAPLCFLYYFTLCAVKSDWMSKGALGDAFLNLRSVISLSTGITQGCEDFTTAMSISAEIPSPHCLLL